MPVVEPIRIDAPLLSEPPSWLEIDLGRLEANVQVLRAALEVDAAGRPDPLMRPARDRKPPLLCGVVKKNAYGLGIEQVSQRLVQRQPALDRDHEQIEEVRKPAADRQPARPHLAA